MQNHLLQRNRQGERCPERQVRQKRIAALQSLHHYVEARQIDLIGFGAGFESSAFRRYFCFRNVRTGRNPEQQLVLRGRIVQKDTLRHFKIDGKKKRRPPSASVVHPDSHFFGSHTSEFRKLRIIPPPHSVI